MVVFYSELALSFRRRKHWSTALPFVPAAGLLVCLLFFLPAAATCEACINEDLQSRLYTLQSGNPMTLHCPLYSPSPPDPPFPSTATITHQYLQLFTLTHHYTITHHFPPLPSSPPSPTITHHHPPSPTITHHYPPLPAISPSAPLPTITHHYPPLPTITHHYPPLPP